MTTPAMPAEPSAPVVQAPSLEGQVVVAPAPVTSPAPVTAPVVTPTPLASPDAASGPVQPSPEALELQALRQQFQQLAAEKQAQQVRDNLTREAQNVYNEEITQGQTPEEALRIAKRHYNLAMRVNQQEQALRQQQEHLQGKQNAAVHFGRLYGVDPSLLLVADDPRAMEQLAQREQHYARLETDMKALKQAQVPTQALNASNGGAGGGVAATSANIDKLWFDYDIANPNMPNPYDAAYRKLVFGG